MWTHIEEIKFIQDDILDNKRQYVVLLFFVFSELLVIIFFFLDSSCKRMINLKNIKQI